MSIRSFFGPEIKPPKLGEQIQYTVDGSVNISGLTINGDSGDPEQVVGNDADGKLAWLTLSTPGAILNIDEVLTNGNNSTLSIDFADQTGIRSVGAILLDGGAGIEIGGTVGTAGQSIISGGAGQPAAWGTAGIDPANPVGYNWIGVQTFDVPPVCGVEPTDDAQLCNKAYVDAEVLGAVGVDPSNVSGYTWAGPQNFELGASSDIAPAVGTDLTNRTYVDEQLLIYSVRQNYYSGTTEPPNPLPNENSALISTWICTSPRTAGNVTWTLPNMAAGYAGKRFTIFYFPSDGIGGSTNIKIKQSNNAATFLNFVAGSGGQTEHTGAQINSGGFLDIIGLSDEFGRLFWVVTAVTTNVSFTMIDS